MRREFYIVKKTSDSFFTNITKLERVQNAAARISTGSVKLSAESHLHAETKMLPVQNHLSLLCSQHLATCLQPGHPSYTTVSADPGPRWYMKKTLQSKFGDQVLRYCINGAVQDPKEARELLHTEYVASAIRARRENRVLNTQAPDIADEEVSLPRQYRTALSQLRSGHCSALNAFKHRIGVSQTYTCPSCHHSTHDTPHLFACPAHPTGLDVRDLWENPAGVADYLFTLQFLRFGAPTRPRNHPPLETRERTGAPG